MMRTILLFFFILAAASAAPLNTERVFASMVRWEGYRTVPYKDGDGWSVGVGHALIMHGEPVKRTYSRAEVYQFFIHDYAVSLEACRNGIRDFDDLPEAAKLVTLNLVWGVGPTGFRRFKDFRFALSHRMWNTSANELGLSRWFHQISPDRANWCLRTLWSL